MKRYLLVLFITTSITGMQTTLDPISQEFSNAIEQGNLAKVQTMLTAHKLLQDNIKKSGFYVNYPVLKYAQKNPALKDNFMQIARYLVSQGASIHPDARAALESYEKTRSVMPSPKAPIVQPVQKPVAIPTPAVKQPVSYTPAPAQPVASTTNMQQFNTLKNLFENPVVNEPAIKDYLYKNPLNLSAQQKSELLQLAVNQIQALPIFNFEPVLNLLKLLKAQGFVPQTDALQKKLADFQKGLGFSNRSGTFETKLVKAIQTNKNIQEIMNLVRNGEDVNQAGKDTVLPLEAAIARKSKEIAEYLLSQGARVDYLLPYQRQALTNLVGNIKG